MRNTDKSPGLSVAPTFPLLNPKQFNASLPAMLGWCLRTCFLLHCVEILLSRGSRVPERLLHPRPCGEHSPLHVCAGLCLQLPQILAPALSPCACCLGAAFLESLSLRHFRLLCGQPLGTGRTQPSPVRSRSDVGSQSGS